MQSHQQRWQRGPSLHCRIPLPGRISVGPAYGLPGWRGEGLRAGPAGAHGASEKDLEHVHRSVLPRGNGSVLRRRRNRHGFNPQNRGFRPRRRARRVNAPAYRTAIRAIREFRSLGCRLAVHGCSFARYSAPVSATWGLAASTAVFPDRVTTLCPDFHWRFITSRDTISK